MCIRDRIYQLDWSFTATDPMQSSILAIININGLEGYDFEVNEVFCNDITVGAFYNNIEYNEFNDELHKGLIFLRQSIKNSEDLLKKSSLISEIDKKFTIFNAKIINKFLNKNGSKPNFIGFHGQTIYHNPLEKISKQIGDGNLLSQLLKKKVIYNFRKNDIQNGGEGAPLTPIYHKVVSDIIYKNYSLEYPINIINIGIKTKTIIKYSNGINLLRTDKSASFVAALTGNSLKNFIGYIITIPEILKNK